MLIQLTDERVRELYAMHSQYPENTIILIVEGRWFEMTFGRYTSSVGAGGFRQHSITFTLRPLFRNL